MKASFDRKAAHYVYVLVRGDLPPTVQAVQACHAAMEISKQNPDLREERLVLLRVEDAAHLQQWHARLHGKRITTALFHEPDHGYGHTALATEPIQGGCGFMGKLPLWGAPDLNEERSTVTVAA